MTSDPSTSNENTPAPNSVTARSRKFRISRLAIKELRETLRDRRTLVTLILMPLLVYPTLSLVFKTFLLSNLGLMGSDKPIELQIAFSGDREHREVSQMLDQIGAGLQAAEQRNIQSRPDPPSAAKLPPNEPGPSEPGPNELGTNEPGPSDETPLDPPRIQFADFSAHKWFFVGPETNASVIDFVELGEADVGVMFHQDGRQRWQLGTAEVIARNDARSQDAAHYLLSRFEKLNELDIQRRLTRARLPTGPALAVSTQIVGEQTSQTVPLASLVPLILVLMTITGAVYPAIDLTAGERERGTLETLMAAPIPRMGILFSKFIAVLTVAILTAVLNLLGMFATVWAFQLDKQFGGGLFNLQVMGQIFLLLILFAAFFSAILLAVTSFAKSFKEAQVYLIPIILLSLGPGLMAMSPGMTLDGLNTITPMVNILLLARDVIQNQVVFVPAIIAVISTLLYTYLAIRLAAYIFGSDSILYSSGGGNFAEMFQRPRNVSSTVPFAATIFCLVLLVPINFGSIGFVGRMPGETIWQLQNRFLTMAVFTFLAFMVVPWLVAKHQNTNIRTAFGWISPRWVFLVAGALLGISLWPLVMYLTTVWHELYGLIFGDAEQAAWAERLVETTSAQVARIRQVPEWVIVVALAIIPAVCEEWFFRGMLLRTLLKHNAAWKSVLLSAAIFGAFHMLSNSVIAVDRFLPTMMVGLMLGYLAYKSNSILPGILLHALNNAIVVFLPYYQQKLMKYDWFPGEEDSIPISWVLIGAAVAAIGLSLVFFAPLATDQLDEDRPQVPQAP